MRSSQGSTALRNLFPHWERIAHSLGPEYIPNFVARASSWLVFFQNPSALGAHRLIDGANIRAISLRTSALGGYLGRCFLIVYSPIANVYSPPENVFLECCLCRHRAGQCKWPDLFTRLRGLRRKRIISSEAMEACRSSVIGRLAQAKIGGKRFTLPVTLEPQTSEIHFRFSSAPQPPVAPHDINAKRRSKCSQAL